MSDFQFLILVLLLALATALTRFIPFILFGGKEKTPGIIEYLGKVLPGAMMGLLVVYCFKDVSFSDFSGLWPLLTASAAVAAVHLWKHNTILSVTLGTAIYMILIRLDAIADLLF